MEREAKMIEQYYPIKESEISHFVKSSSCMDQSTRGLAQSIYARGMVSLSGDVALIKDLDYQIYKLKNQRRADIKYIRDFILSHKEDGSCPFGTMNEGTCHDYIDDETGGCGLCIFDHAISELLKKV